MALITKQTAPHFRRLANEARIRNKQIRDTAKAQIEQLLNSGFVPDQFSDKLSVILTALMDLVHQEIAGGAKGRIRLLDLLKAQRMLLEQVKLVRGEPLPGPGRPKGIQVKPVNEGQEQVKQGARIEPQPALPDSDTASEPGNCGICAPTNGVLKQSGDNETPQLL